MFNNSRIIICGGGTGGHLFPAISIKTQLSNRGAQVLYMGSKHGIESIRMTKDKNTYFLDKKTLRISKNNTSDEDVGYISLSASGSNIIIKTCIKIPCKKEENRLQDSIEIK